MVQKIVKASSHLQNTHCPDITVQTKVLQSKVAKSKQKILHTYTDVHGTEVSPKWQSPNIQTNITVQTFINYSPNKYCSATKVELEKQPKFSTIHILLSKQITVHTVQIITEFIIHQLWWTHLHPVK